LDQVHGGPEVDSTTFSSWTYDIILFELFVGSSVFSGWLGRNPVVADDDAQQVHDDG